MPLQAKNNIVCGASVESIQLLGVEYVDVIHEGTRLDKKKPAKWQGC